MPEDKRLVCYLIPTFFKLTLLSKKQGMEHYLEAHAIIVIRILMKNEIFPIL